MSQKRGLAIFFGSAIALAVCYAATYPRFHPQPSSPAASSPPASTAPAPAATLTNELAATLPPANPLSWTRLTPQQRTALAPFAAIWDKFSDVRKRKWLKIAARFEKMSPDAQKRLQEKMTVWARMTPEQHRIARENYLISKRLSEQMRERAWKAYQKLPEAQKRRLAAERHRRPTVVSAPPSGRTDRDINRLVNAREAPASAAASPAAASGAPGAAVPASPATVQSVPVPSTPVSPADAPSLFKGS